MYLFIWLSDTLHCIKANAQRIPLGMANGYIPAHRLTSSGKFPSYPPQSARLGIQRCWKNRYMWPDSDSSDHHQVDFGRVVILTGIATQGDPTNINDFVEKFYLKISNSSSSFTEFKDCSAVRKVCPKKLFLPSSLTFAYDNGNEIFEKHCTID